jgi:DNA polymerase-3 subunit alpha
MAERFSDLPEAMNSVAIAQRCNLTIPRQELPARLPDPVRRDDRATSEGTRQRQGSSVGSPRSFPMPRARRQASDTSRDSLEVKTIVQMGYAGYFLIVADSSTGQEQRRPGRSRARFGCWLAGCLQPGITDLDPLRYTPALRAVPQP